MTSPVSNYLNLGGVAGTADDDAGAGTATEAGSFSEGTSLALLPSATVSIGVGTSSSFPEEVGEDTGTACSPALPFSSANQRGHLM